MILGSHLTLNGLKIYRAKGETAGGDTRHLKNRRRGGRILEQDFPPPVHSHT